MSRPTLVARYKAWSGQLSPWRRVALSWAQAVVWALLAMTLLRVIGLVDSWAVVGLYTAVYGVGLAVMVLLIRRRARSQRRRAQEEPRSS